MSCGTPEKPVELHSPDSAHPDQVIVVLTPDHSVALLQELQHKNDETWQDFVYTARETSTKDCLDCRHLLSVKQRGRREMHTGTRFRLPCKNCHNTFCLDSTELHEEIRSKRNDSLSLQCILHLFKPLFSVLSFSIEAWTGSLVFNTATV